MKAINFFHARGMLAFLCLFLFLSGLIGQPPDVLWYKELGDVMGDIGFDAIEGEDGEYFVIGRTQVSENNWDAYVAKLDNNGDIVWENTYGGNMDEQIVSICPGLYFGYVVAGYTSTDASGLSDIWILYIDDNGDSIASVKYGSWSSDQAYCIRPNVDQGFIVSSRSAIYQWGDQIHLMKLDISLDTIWTKLYGGPMQDYGHMVEETSDYGYIIAGRSYTTVYPESGDAWVIKTDDNGDTLWTKKYGGNDEDIFFALVETDDGYIFAGQTWSFDAQLIDMYVVRTDDEGEVIWSNLYGGEGADYAYRIFEAPDGNYVISGYSTSFNDSRDVYLIKIDGDGNLLWEQNYGDELDNEYMYGGVPTSDGGYLFAGKLDYYYSNQDDIFALKLGPEVTGLEQMTILNKGDFYNYPNPVKDKSTFYFDLESKSMVNLSVYDAFGRHVATLFNGYQSNGTQQIDFNFSGFETGIYFVKLEADDQVEVRKIIVSR